MITAYGTKEYRIILIPIKSMATVERIQSQTDAGVFCFYRDGKEHRFNGKRIPAIVLPGALKIFHITKADLSSAGYMAYWQVFEDCHTGELTCGNKPSFSKGTTKEREFAKRMPIIDRRFFETESVEYVTLP